MSTWLAYPYGIAYLLTHHGMKTGCDIVVYSQIPIGSGLSSSAALACSLGLGLCELYSLGLSRLDIAQMVRQVENTFAGVPSGILDPLASLTGKLDNLVYLDTLDNSYRYIPFNPTSCDLELLLIDSNVRHRLSTSQYAQRSQECLEICENLSVTSLREVSLDNLESALELISSPVLKRRCRHVVTENRRVELAVECIENQDFVQLGALLTQGHESLRDDYEVSVPELDMAVEVAITRGCLGARMTGGGFGGSAIALVPKGSSEAVRKAISEAYDKHGYALPDFSIPRPSQGATRQEDYC